MTIQQILLGVGGVVDTYNQATGGTITTSGDWKIHSFTSTGSSTFTITELGTDSDLEYLVVAGGGSAHADECGGGAGGMLEGTGWTAYVGDYSITGAGLS